VCSNGDHPAKERQREKTFLNGGFDDVDGGAGCPELNEWQVSKLLCLFCHPYSVKPLWILLAKIQISCVPNSGRMTL
jgi:hypothetical protein